MSEVDGGGSGPQKRPAYESAKRLAERTAFDPAMKRPSSIVAGALLVFLRVVSGTIVLTNLLLNRDSWSEGLELLIGDVDVTENAAALGVGVYVVLTAIGLLFWLLLGILILQGRNFARVLVMFFSVISITSSFAAWWFTDLEIRITGSLLSLALEILILLALSSRSAAAYARRNQGPPKS
ncbi:hypothetical protein ACWPKO_19045 (plasmid) [Coraliomargarita sp. W4R53]